MWQHNFFTTKKTFRIVQETAVINFTNERGTSCSTPSGSCSSFSSFCFETLLISAGNKLSCAEDFADFSFAGEIQSDFSCDQESPLWPIPKGLPAPAHRPCSTQSCANKREEMSILRSGNAPGTALVHHILQRLPDALGKHGVIGEEDLGVGTGPVKVAVIQLCVLCALK